jgi:undecaprenyl-phosphate 4-deoxy-4-formamido-L-arabinose transferase
MADEPALSIVIPCYNSGAALAALVEELAALQIDGGHEIVLVNDGSQDDTAARCRALVRGAAVPITFVDLSRNFGEHNAVMAGLRVARGAHVVTMDDDGQNPPGEVEKLYHYARASGADVIYTYYAEKQHASWRNLGSWLANRVADLLLDKPKGLYLSSFRCMKAFLVEQICRYDGPHPYIDGLLFQVTQNAERMQVTHRQRREGRSAYTLRRLLRLWLSMLLNFSVVPLRISSALGLVFSVVGFVGTAFVAVNALLRSEPPGWGSLMGALFVFFGVELLTVGLLGEYVGRMYLATNRRPQSVVREIVRSDAVGVTLPVRGDARGEGTAHAKG